MNYLFFNSVGTPKNTVKPVVASNGLTVLNQQVAHSSRSEKYALIKTEDVVKIMSELGFEASLVKQERSRKETYKGFGTHLVAFSKPDFAFENIDLRKELRPVILLQNSYHGRKPATLEIALFRLVCSNGLHVSQSLSEKIVLRHKGSAREQIIAAVKLMGEKFNQGVAEKIVKMQSRVLTAEEKIGYAEAALRARFAANENFIRGDAQDLLTTHRVEDQGDSLWLVYQRIQENLGLNFRGTPINVTCVFKSEDKEKPGTFTEERRKMRAINRIDEVERINRFLFDKAADLASVAIVS